VLVCVRIDVVYMCILVGVCVGYTCLNGYIIEPSFGCVIDSLPDYLIDCYLLLSLMNQALTNIHSRGKSSGIPTLVFNHAKLTITL
jgi:hypothetical protein